MRYQTNSCQIHSHWVPTSKNVIQLLSAETPQPHGLKLNIRTDRIDTVTATSGSAQKGAHQNEKVRVKIADGGKNT